MAHVDKVIFVNKTALNGKYGAQGVIDIDAALSRLVAADGVRTLASRVLAIDDAAEMASVGGKPVVGAPDERGAKAAVDAAFAALAPSYGLLIDGPDVIPHINLAMVAGLDDFDKTIESDLPYASPGAWSRQPASYLAVTRIIGRVPATVGTPSSEAIVKLIDAAATHQPTPLQDFQPPFAISADVWLDSTKLSMATTYGAGIDVLEAPPACHPAIDATLDRKVHFINCHGATSDPHFYGQQGLDYPIAMSSKSVEPHVSVGTVVAAECCYGAQLYDFDLPEIDQPICMSYLLGGACAFLGSTCIAYGPSTGNGQADLLTQFFLQSLLTGKSSGRALLEARQQFVRTQVMSNPANLKTLAQFVLLGDPSCVPCKVEPDAKIAAMEEIGAKAIAVRNLAEEVVDESVQRMAKRTAQYSAGIAAAAVSSRPGHLMDLGADVRTRIRSLAQARGLKFDTINILETIEGVHARAAAKAQEPVTRKVAVVVDKSASTEGHPVIKLMIAYMFDDKVGRVEMIESR